MQNPARSIVAAITAILPKKNQKLEFINSEMINDKGVLTIPEGITKITASLDDLLAKANISTDIKVVVFPKTLQEMELFFYKNKSVRLAIFNSQVALTSNNNKGAFEDSNIEEIIIPKGFADLEYQRFDGQVQNDDHLYRISPLEKQWPAILTTFFNCHKLKNLVVTFDQESNFITHINTTFSLTNPDLDWQAINDVMLKDRYNHSQHKLVIKGIPESFIFPEKFDSYKDVAIKEYTTMHQLKQNCPIMTIPHTN